MINALAEKGQVRKYLFKLAVGRYTNKITIMWTSIYKPLNLYFNVGNREHNILYHTYIYLEHDIM